MSTIIPVEKPQDNCYCCMEDFSENSHAVTHDDKLGRLHASIHESCLKAWAAYAAIDNRIRCPMCQEQMNITPLGIQCPLRPKKPSPEYIMALMVVSGLSISVAMRNLTAQIGAAEEWQEAASIFSIVPSVLILVQICAYFHLF